MIDQKTILRIAQLARLKITSEEATHYGEQLTKVLNHFDQISGINTDGIEPLITPTDIAAHLREDTTEHSYPVEQMLENAPDRLGNLFKVPPVVG